MIGVAIEQRWGNEGKLVGEEGRYTGNNLANQVGTMRSGGVRLQLLIRSGGVCKHRFAVVVCGCSRQFSVVTCVGEKGLGGSMDININKSLRVVAIWVFVTREDEPTMANPDPTSPNPHQKRLGYAEGEKRRHHQQSTATTFDNG
ncbi:hypothetical protein L2E82_40763 [Cichorium intybus]|uniref:Uncharacterized protein n=1 Tax=Cichorium intybus TaxID=13427 RepID=A0ACB9AMM5_CICIN|nr:hypothetical protein L2E82_40763 [Cichorium intybus]